MNVPVQRFKDYFQNKDLSQNEMFSEACYSYKLNKYTTKQERNEISKIIHQVSLLRIGTLN